LPTVFRLVPTSVTLNDLERRRLQIVVYILDTALFCFISPNAIALQAYFVTVVEDRPILSALSAKTHPPCSAVFLRELSYLSAVL